MLPLKGCWQRRVGPLFDDEIDGLGADEFDVGASGAKCVLLGTTSPFLQATPKRMRSAARP